MFSPNFGAGKTNFAHEALAFGSAGRLCGHCTGSRIAYRRKPHQTRSQLNDAASRT